MKRGMLGAVVLALMGWAMTGFAAETAKAKTPKAAKTIRVLLLTGGHPFEQEAFYGMFDSLPGIQYTKALLPENADLLKPGLEKQYDCIVRYDMCKTDLTPQQQEGLVALLNQGIGLVPLHHSIGAQKGWEEYRKIIGGKYIFEDCVIDGQKYVKTPWSHGETLNVTVADPKHPITRGVKDFTIEDETYGKFYVAPGVHVLLKTDHPKNNPEVAWTTQYGRSRVFYLMLGHDGKAYANPSFQKLLVQGIRWTVQGKAAKKK